MKSVLARLIKLSSYFSKGLEFISVILIGCMLLLAFAQVIMRYVFNSPFTWSDELVRYLFIWCIFLGSSIAMAKGVHLKAGVYITKRLPLFAKIIVDYLIVICVFAVLIVLIWKGIELIEATKVRLSTALRIPMRFIYISVPINAAIMMYFFLLSLGEKYIMGKNESND
jgi:TRAP-type C4-dicarboxylate transport system permease small subunit